MRMHLLVALALVAACDEKKPAAPVAEPAHAPLPGTQLPAILAEDGGNEPVTYGELLRMDFNELSQANLLPFFWRADSNGDKLLSPDELVILQGPYPQKTWVVAGGFSKDFEAAYRSMLKLPDLSTLPEAEGKRQYLLKQELKQGVPTLVETDTSPFTAQDKAALGPLLQAAALVERLYDRQLGTLDLAGKVPAGDTLSRAVFHRNQGPFCAAPKTENDPACTALPGARRVFGLYPADVQGDAKFCQALEAAPNGKDLSGDHFSVVQRADAGFVNVPYSVAWKDDMEAVAQKLEEAAAALGPDEAAFKAYLLADAAAFRTNDWEPANAAWVAMGPQNSRWYLRAGPDEVYFEPCAWKAGFAFMLARINPDSLAWQKKLEPVKNDMEKALAALAGPPYKARQVAFKLPDFIDIVLNAGDQRPPHGATLGQSLPNWGPVAEKGGRTVVMTNLYTDADSQKQLRGQMASLFCPATMKQAATDAASATMSTVLHEAAHNLGPAHDYVAFGKKDHEAFGGPLSSVMEELKAQTSALYFADWLVAKKVITVDEAQRAHVRDVAWAFGHISRGMYDGEGKPKTYSQLASMQLGWLRKGGALVWKADQKAANGADQGCFELDLGAKWKASLDGLAKAVFQAKAKGDRKAAEQLKADFVDDTGDWKQLRQTITERWLQAPKATFVYGLH